MNLYASVAKWYLPDSVNKYPFLVNEWIHFMAGTKYSAENGGRFPLASSYRTVVWVRTSLTGLNTLCFDRRRSFAWTVEAPYAWTVEASQSLFSARSHTTLYYWYRLTLHGPRRFLDNFCLLLLRIQTWNKIFLSYRGRTLFRSAYI